MKNVWKVIYGAIETFDETLAAVGEDYEPHSWQMVTDDGAAGFCMLLISKAELQRRTAQAALAMQPPPGIRLR